MSKNRETLSCFRDQPHDAPMPQPLTAARIREAIQDGTRKVQDFIAETWSPESASTSGRCAKNRAIVFRLSEQLHETLETKVGREYPTFRELRRAYDKAREAVRLATTGTVFRKDKRIDSLAGEVVWDEFQRVTRQIHEEVAASIRTLAEGQKTEEREKLQQALVLRVVQQMQTAGFASPSGAVLVNGNETVNADLLSLYEDFLLCVQEAINASSVPGSVRRQDVEREMEQLTVQASEREQLTAWLAQWMPADLSVTRADAERQPALAGELQAALVLVPGKFAFYLQRRSPDGPPHWQMTAEEIAVLQACLAERNGASLPPEQDEVFLADAAKMINRCSANLPLARGAIEVKQQVLALTAAAKETLDSPPTTDGPPPPPADISATLPLADHGTPSSIVSEAGADTVQGAGGPPLEPLADTTPVSDVIGIASPSQEAAPHPDADPALRQRVEDLVRIVDTWGKVVGQLQEKVKSQEEALREEKAWSAELKTQNDALREENGRLRPKAEQHGQVAEENAALRARNQQMQDAGEAQREEAHEKAEALRREQERSTQLSQENRDLREQNAALRRQLEEREAQPAPAPTPEPSKPRRQKSVPDTVPAVKPALAPDRRQALIAQIAEKKRRIQELKERQGLSE